MGDRTWQDVLAAQCGVISREQALAGGLTRHEWAARCLGYAGWRRVVAGVCAVGVPTPVQAAWAAALATGTGGLVTGLTLLVVHGLTLPAPVRTTVLVPDSHHLVQHPQIRVVRARQYPERHPALWPPQVRLPRATVDAATYEARTDKQARFYLVKPVQDGLVTPAQLTAEVARRPRLHRGAVIREHVDELRSGVRSLRERDLLLALRRRGTRPPDHLQFRVDAAGRRYLDGWWAAERVAVEVQGPQHFVPEATEGELLRISALSVPGDRAVIQVPSWLLPDDAGAFLDLIDAALRAGRLRRAA